MKTNIIYIVIILISFSSCNNSSKKNYLTNDNSSGKNIKMEKTSSNDGINTKNEVKVNQEKSRKKIENITQQTKEKIVKHDEYIEIYEKFLENSDEIIGQKHNVNLVNYPFLSLSAYIQPKKSNVLLHYRYFNGEKWSDWLPFPEDKHIYNEKRTVFGLINIQDNIKIIQFKSNIQINKIVFNIFTPKN